MMYDKNHHSIVKQFSSNKKIFKKTNKQIKSKINEHTKPNKNKHKDTKKHSDDYQRGRCRVERKQNGDQL